MLTLLTKLLGKLDVLLNVFVGNSWSGALDGLEEVLDGERGFQEIISVNVKPSHRLRIRVTRRAGQPVVLYLARIIPVSRSHLLVVRGRLYLANGLHQGIPHHNTDISTRVARGDLPKMLVIVGCEGARSVLHMQLEHPLASRSVGEGNVDALLKTTSNGTIEGPGKIGGTEDEDARLIVTNTVHLNQELGLDTARSLRFTIAALTTERVNLIDEDDGWLVGTGHLKQVLHQALRLSHPLGDQICRRDGDEGGLGLSGHGLGKVGLTSTGWAIQEDALPRGPLASEQVGELDRQDDSLLQSLLGPLQTSNIVPTNIGCLLKDSL